MLNWFFSGGPFMWIILLFLIIEIFVATRAFRNIKQKRSLKAALDLKTLLVLGVSAMAVGAMGQLIGIYAALGQIIIATDISPALVLGGFRVASVSTVFGTSIFLITMVVWFTLRELDYRLMD